MARPKSTLEQLVARGTFLARRHADRLASEPLLRDPRLRELQELYRRSRDPLDAVMFERAVRARGRTRQLTGVEAIYANIGPGMLPIERFRRSDTGTIDWAALEALERRWRRWDQQHGLAWRLRHSCAGNSDLLRLGGRRYRSLPDVEDHLDELVAAFWTERDPDEPLPDPPGLALAILPT